MKYFLATLLILIFAQFNVSAQRSTLFQPIPEDIGFTPYQRNIPFELQFLVNDELTGILFNPSMLSNLKSNQIYTSIIPGSNRNYRVAYLSDNKWFITGSFNNNYDEFFTTREIIENQSSFDIFGDNSFAESRVIQDVNERNDVTRSNMVEVRVAKLITETPDKSRSLGLSFAYQNSEDINTRNSVLNNESMYMEFRNDTLLVDRNDEQNRQIYSSNISDADKFLVGLEYSSSSNRLMIQHRVYAQYNSQENSNTENRVDILENNEVMEGVSSGAYFSQTNRPSSSFQSYTPWVFGYKLYLNREINWLGKDYLYTRINAFHGVDKSDVGYMDIIERTVISNGVLSNIESRNINFEDSGLSENQTNANLRFGYVLQIDLEDITFFTGISNSFQYIQHSGYFIGNLLGLAKFDDSYHRYEASIPVFGEYKVNDWMSLFGGANLSGTYSSNSQKNKTVVSFEDTALDTQRSEVQNSSASYFRDVTSTYFGLKASHKSGLTFMADINGDLARLSGWYFTLGYKF